MLMSRQRQGGNIEMRKWTLIGVILIIGTSLTYLLLDRVTGIANIAPPRSTEKFVGEIGESVVTLPVSADLTGLSRDLEREIPRRLWAIDQAGQTCIPPKTVKILFIDMTTPTIKCRIVGEVTRGAMTLTGSGKDIFVSMPLNATIRAQDIGGILKQETATARAIVLVKLRLNVTPDWKTTGTAEIGYNWSDAPHLDFMGQRIDLADAAEEKLAPIIARLEQSIPREISRLPLRNEALRIWNSAFTSLSLNRQNPSVWMRITPRKVHYSGYQINNGRLFLSLGMTANTETFVGARPPDPQRSALPRLDKQEGATKMVLLKLPVIAAYKELEPVLMRALQKREARPFNLPGIGPVKAHFVDVTIYGTLNEKIAVGLQFTAQSPSGSLSSGTVWLTAKPVTEENSAKVEFKGLQVTGVTNSIGTDLLIKLVNTTAMSDLLADELQQNFENDLLSLRKKVDRALANKQSGGLIIKASINDIKTGRLRATPAGLYLPVEARGTATVRISP